MRTILAGTALAAALVALTVACGGGGGSSGTGGAAGTTAQVGGGNELTGTVGPGFTITLEQDGQKVTSLPAGTYTLVVSDKSSIHSFTLEQEEGGDFEQDVTSVPSIGTQTVKVNLTKGEWKFYCPPHESQMNGTFTVT